MSKTTQGSTPEAMSSSGKTRRSLLTASAATGLGLSLAAAPVFAQQKAQYRLRMQSFLGPGWSEWDELIPRYAARVKEMTDGRVEITAYPPGALVPTFEMLDAVGRRIIDIGFGAQLYWRGRFPFAQWSWGVPFALNGVDEYEYLWWEAGMLEFVRERFAKAGVHLIAPIYSDEWGSTISTKPIRRLTDFQGLKIRSGGVGGELWKEFGASIVTLPGEELYTGLATGVLDGANWGSPYGNIATKLQEVAKFYTGPSILTSDAEDLFINKANYDKMPRDVQMALEVSARSFALERYAYSKGKSAEAFGQLRDAGVEIIVLPPEDIQTMKDKIAELVPKMAGDDADSQAALDMIYKVRDLFAQRPAGF
ncbi:TRAP transporter substrate-binding protein DctP [Alcaligenaceae bacterium]|nr:TRAP transporter substrate-binding protein DctP [Alcaligenaceae bacterium]